jgi:DNA-binding MarR family transcriptional regulator
LFIYFISFAKIPVYLLLHIKKERGDARKKSISITESGASKLAEAIPLWEQAQSRIEKGLGSERYRDFLKMLSDVAQLIE